ncbi:MAG: TRAP transporter substrate-binding protein DctP [Deltaproteobacteria bacterium]|nr:TRAP transporter substrate-binding protein DctP [Deltaproteobacteria bacterium]
MKKMMNFKNLSVALLLVALGMMVGFSTSWAQKKPIELKISHQAFPPNTFMVASSAHWAKLIKERTNGEVELKFFYDTLGKGPGIMSAAQEGIADGFVCINSLITTRVKALNVSEIATFTAADKYLQNVKAIRPVMNKIYDEQGIQYVGSIFSYSDLAYTHQNRFLNNLDAFKGQKIRQIGMWATKVLIGYGGVPVNVMPPELYAAAQRGIVDGVCTINMLVDAFKLYEVQKYNTIFPGKMTPYASVGLNKAVFNKLDKKTQDIIIQAGIEAEAYSWDYGRKEEAALQQKLSKLMKYHILTPEEMKPFEAIIDKLAPEVIEYSGPLGKELAEALLKVKKSK